jgi:hypothetical protein
VSEAHFITRELAAQKMDPLDISWEFSHRIWMEPQGAKVLIDQDRHPALAINQPEPESSVIWMGVPTRSSLRDSAYWRHLETPFLSLAALEPRLPGLTQRRLRPPRGDRD